MMTEPSMSEQELAELAELLELAKLTEQKARDLCDLTMAIDQKYEKRLAQIRLDRKLQAGGFKERL